MNVGDAIEYISVLFVVLSVSLFFVLARKFRPACADEEIHTTVGDIHLSAQP